MANDPLANDPPSSLGKTVVEWGEPRGFRALDPESMDLAIRSLICSKAGGWWGLFPTYLNFESASMHGWKFNLVCVEVPPSLSSCDLWRS